MKNTEFFLTHVARVYGQKRAGQAAHVLWAFLHGSAVLLDAGLVNAEAAFANLKLGPKMWADGSRKA